MTENKPAFFSSSIVRMGVVALVAGFATVLVLLLNSNISKRKDEARQTSLRLVELDEKTVDPAQWGKNFPREYDSYQRTVEKME